MAEEQRKQNEEKRKERRYKQETEDRIQERNVEGMKKKEGCKKNKIEGERKKNEMTN